MEKENSFYQEKSFTDPADRNKTGSSDKAFGIRDALLVKCRDTIESLNQELDDEKRQKRQLEGRIKELEHSNAMLDHKARSQEVTIIELKEELEECQTSIEVYQSELQKLSMKSMQDSQGSTSSNLKVLEKSLVDLQEENDKLRARLEGEKLRSRESEKRVIESDRLDLEKIELELEELYEKKHRCMIKDFEKKQEILREEMSNAIDEIEVERMRYQDMYKACVDENNSLRQEIKYLQNMLQRKQNQLEKHSQQSLDQLQNILEKKNTEQTDGFKRVIEELEKEKEVLEKGKDGLEEENFRLRERVETLEDYEKKYETLNNEYFILKANIFELEQKVLNQKNEKKMINKNLDGLRKVLLDNESGQEVRNAELVKIKYQALLQAEMQKRLKDKQEYKENLVRDKEAFLAKLRAKDEKISKLEIEKTELLCQVNYLQSRKNEESTDSDKRIVNADTARKLCSRISDISQGVSSLESNILNLESRFSKY